MIQAGHWASSFIFSTSLGETHRQGFLHMFALEMALNVVQNDPVMHALGF